MLAKLSLDEASLDRLIVINNYRGLVDALKAERLRRGWSCEDLDAITGLADRYVNKLENYESSNGRHMGELSLWTMLEALGFEICLQRKPPRHHPYDPNE